MGDQEASTVLLNDDVDDDDSDDPDVGKGQAQPSSTSSSQPSTSACRSSTLPLSLAILCCVVGPLSLTALVCRLAWLYRPFLTSDCSSPFPSDPPLPYSSPYASLYLSALPACGNSSLNHVLEVARDSHHPFTLEPYEARPWSLSASSFPTSAPSSPPCPSVDVLLSAVRFGHRRFRSAFNSSAPCDRTLPPALSCEVEPQCQSDFVPYGCSVGWLSARDACELMGQWSGLYLLGDSLTRHLTQAVLMLLTADLQWGGLPRGEPNGALYRWCQCDGQFSAAHLCRDWDINRFMQHEDVRRYGVCAGSAGWAFEYRYPRGGPNLTLQLPCSADDRRPKAVFLQGGVHLQLNAEKWVQSVVEPNLRALKELHAHCPHQDVYVLMSGMVSQHRHGDVAYPEQSRERAEQFNAAVERYAGEEWGVRWVDFGNLTRNAASSDGLHQLTDANLVKALAVLRSFDLMRQEGTPTFTAGAATEAAAAAPGGGTGREAGLV